MATYLQPVDIAERCYLYEVLMWVTFQRLPVAFYDYQGRDVRDTVEAGGYSIEVADHGPSEDEAKRANIPVDPYLVATMEERPTLDPEFYDDMLRRYDPTEEERAKVLADRQLAEQLQIERRAWEPHYQRTIEYPASRIFVALKSGQLSATGRLLPGRNSEEAHQLLDESDQDVFDFAVTDIPSTFWSLSGIDFKASAAQNGSSVYCHIACRTTEVLSLFPGDREHLSGVERVGDCYVVNEAVAKQPIKSQRGRPPYPWESFYLEIAAMVERGQLPAKKEAAIQHFQDWFQVQHGICPSRASVGEKLTPYYERFVRRRGQKR